MEQYIGWLFLLMVVAFDTGWPYFFAWVVKLFGVSKAIYISVIYSSFLSYALVKALNSGINAQICYFIPIVVASFLILVIDMCCGVTYSKMFVISLVIASVGAIGMVIGR